MKVNLKKHVNYFIILTNFILAATAILQTSLTKAIASAAQNQIDDSQRLITVAENYVKFTLKEDYPEIRLNLLLTTDFIKADTSEGYIFSSRDWNRESKNKKFEISINNVGKKIIDTNLQIKYICFAYKDLQDKSYNFKTIEENIPFKAAPNIFTTYSITDSVNSMVDFLTKEHYGGALPDNLTMEISVDNISAVSDTSVLNINPKIYYIIGKVGTN